MQPQDVLFALGFGISIICPGDTSPCRPYAACDVAPPAFGLSCDRYSNVEAPDLLPGLLAVSTDFDEGVGVYA